MFINDLYETSTPENANLLVIQIFATVYRVVNAVSDKSELLRMLSSNPIFSRLTLHSSENVIKNELISFCNNAKMLVSCSQRRETEILCDRVIQIIDEQYGDENLSLTGVSNELAVSPNYLSALVKKTKKKIYITGNRTQNEGCL